MWLLTCLVVSKQPLYTLPIPPSPNRLSVWKFSVAVANSRNVKIWALFPSSVTLWSSAESQN